MRMALEARGHEITVADNARHRLRTRRWS
jgi:hypothetical protein